MEGSTRSQYAEFAWVVTPLKPQDSNRKLSELMSILLRGIDDSMESFSTKPFQRAKIGNCEFLRCEWEGKEPSSSSSVTGIVYATCVDVRL